MKKNIYILFILIFIGCVTQQDEDLVEFGNTKYFSNDSFENKVELKQQIFNEDFIGDPARLALIDTFLFVVDIKLDTIIHLFSSNSKAYLGKLISRGSGPSELITCSDIETSRTKRNFWAYDITSRKWIEYNIDSLSKNQKHENIIDFNNISSDYKGIFHPQWLTDSTLVCSSLFKYNERFFVFDKKLEMKKAIYNPYLKIYPKFGDNILGDIFSSFISIKPDKSKIVIAGRYLDLIEIYNDNGDIQTMLKGPDKYFDFKFDIESSIKQGSLIKLPETKRAYIGIKTTDNCIYLLYSGKERKDPSHYSYASIIYAFDWNGQPLKKYELDAPILSFEIDEKNNIIYALHQDSYIITYKI